jgi:hypothetical protein
MKLEHDNQPWIGLVVPLLTYSPTFPPMQYGHVAEGILLPKSYYIYLFIVLFSYQKARITFFFLSFFEFGATGFPALFFYKLMRFT